MMVAKLRLLGVAVGASLAVACVVESDPAPTPTRPSTGGYAPGTGAGGSTSGSPGASSSGSSSASPILVDVDTDKTMNANPGEGVGVFAEYATGGHWHVWWTCDTNVNPQGPLTCDFDVRVNVTQGAIRLVKADTPDGGAKLSGTPIQQVEAATVTGAQIHGLYLDTDPGAKITLEATIGGQHDGRYFFFVQNGQVNGGFKGTLTDPLMLEGAKP